MPSPNESPKKKEIWINGNKYETTNIIGQGGQGIVYRAMDSSGGKFAIKVVSATKHSPSRNFERTLEEAQWCEKWHSKRIIQYVAHKVKETEEDRVLTILMPLFECSLKEKLKNGVDASTALNYLIDICSAIEACHKENVVHRDLKPANILISAKGNAIVSDFGAAHFPEFVKTEKGDRIANRDYCAPEQRLEPSSDSPVDVYAIGLIANELFTGALPFGDESKSIKITNPLYAEVNQLVRLMTRHDPEQRISIAAAKNEFIRIRRPTNECPNSLKCAIGLKSATLDERDLEEAARDVAIVKKIIGSGISSFPPLNRQYRPCFSCTADRALLDAYQAQAFLNECLSKFRYECNGALSLLPNAQKPYSENMPTKEDCNHLEKQLENLDSTLLTRSGNYILGSIRKIFCSCTYYHARELLRHLSEIEEKAERNLRDAPLFWIVDLLFSETPDLLATAAVDFENWITIEKREMADSRFAPSLFLEQPADASCKSIIKEIAKEFPGFSFITLEHNTKLFFPSFKEYEDFKSRSLEAAREDPVLESDVRQILNTAHFSDEFVSLTANNAFDVPHTLGSIFGRKTNLPER